MKKMFVLLAMVFTSLHSYADAVDDIMSDCYRRGGAFKREKILEESIGGGKRKECYKVLCYKTVDIGSVDLSGDIDSIRAQFSEKGKSGAIVAYDPNKCVTTNDVNDEDLTTGNAVGNAIGNAIGNATGNANGNGGSVGGGGGRGNITIRGAGSFGVCTSKCKNPTSRRCVKCLGQFSVGDGGLGNVTIRGNGSFGVCSSKCKNPTSRRCQKCLDLYGYETGNGGGSGAVGSAVGGGDGGAGDVGGAVGSSIGGGDGGGGAVGYAVGRAVGRGNGRGGGGGRCTYDVDLNECIGDDEYNYIISGGYDHDCVNCRGGGGVGYRQHWLSGLAEFTGALAPWAASIVGSIQQRKMYESMQGTIRHGFDQCRLGRQGYLDYAAGQQNAYVNYNTQQQGPLILPGEYGDMTVSPEMFNNLTCNGYSMGGFAGFGGMMGNGFGGFGNPWMSAGYSPGFMGGMMGPYGMMNPYGGIGGGFGMGMPGMGGIGGGIGIGMPGMGGIGGGVGIGMPGMGMGGMGMPGFGGGMFGGGWPGPIGGGMGGYFPPGGLGGGIGIGLGANMGGWGNGGFGMSPGSMWGAGSGTVPWGMGNNGGYWGGTGGFGGGMGGFGGGMGGFGGGMGGFGMGGNPQQDWMNSNQAFYGGLGAGQQALGQQINYNMQGMYGMGMGGMGGGMFGSVPYMPGNMGFGISAGFGFGT
jgi:hypothetical protein